MFQEAFDVQPVLTVFEAVARPHLQHPAAVERHLVILFLVFPP